MIPQSMNKTSFAALIKAASKGVQPELHFRVGLPWAPLIANQEKKAPGGSSSELEWAGIVVWRSSSLTGCRRSMGC